MSVTNGSPLPSSWHVTGSKDRSAELHAQRRKQQTECWRQAPRKVFPSKPNACFIKPAGTIIHRAICRANHRMSFLPKKRNSCEVRCAGKTKSSVAKRLCKQKGLAGSASHGFFVLLGKTNPGRRYTWQFTACLRGAAQQGTALLSAAFQEGK